MADAKTRGRLIRNAPMALDRNHPVGRLRTVRCLSQVRLQLVQSLATDAARTAVFEQEHRPLARLGNSCLERSDVDKRFQFIHRGETSLSGRWQMVERGWETPDEVRWATGASGCGSRPPRGLVGLRRITRRAGAEG